MLFKPDTPVEIEIFFEDPPLVLRTRVISCDLESIKIAAPLVNDKRIGVPTETRIILTAKLPEGVTIVETRVEGVLNDPNPHWVAPIPQDDKIERFNRRIGPRTELDLHFLYWPEEETDTHRSSLLQVRNIGPAGTLISVDRVLKEGQKIVIDLTPLLRITGEPIDERVAVLGKVLEKLESEELLYRLYFENLNETNLDLLNKALRRLKVNPA